MGKRVLHDHYFNQAKAEGYVARSAYKLKQIQYAKQLISRGDRVLDLGCAPGAWVQVALELVGPAGRVVGVDLQEVRRSFGPNAHTLVGDAFQIDPEHLTQLAGGPFDIVLSDMAPNTSGHGDAERSAQLCRRVLEIAAATLRPGGSLAMKIFEGGEYNDVLRETGAMFQAVKGYKPRASRDVSREMYIIAQHYKQGTRPPHAQVDRSLPPHLRFPQEG